MKSDRERHFGPSGRNEITYSRTYVMYLVPLAAVFTIAWIGGAAWLAVGPLRANGEAIVGGAFVTVFGLPLVAIAWKNARSALKDRKIQKRQLR